MKKLVLFILAFMATVLLVACKKKNITTKSLNVIHETKFNSSYAQITRDDMLKLGFKYGDSCDVKFSNGVEFNDIPFYDGYYTRSGSILICAYQGYPYVQITENNSSSFYDDMRLQEGDTVIISLNKKGAYKTVQDTFSMSYSNNRKDFASDETFANFREFSSGALKSNTLYRGASPFNNNYNRAKYVDNLLKENKINFILDLADSKEDMDNYFKSLDFNSTYAKSLYDDDKIALLNMGSNFRSDTYKKALVSGLRKLIQCDGPFYIHCTEGKDRTGFVCALLAGLAGSSYEEMKNDYMITYNNYFKLNENKAKYDAVVNLRFDEFLEYLSGETDINVIKNIHYTQNCVDYLLSGGMTNEEVRALNEKITNFLF